MLRFYALHRFIRAEPEPKMPARVAEDFDLDRAMAEGKVDFGSGQADRPGDPRAWLSHAAAAVLPAQPMSRPAKTSRRTPTSTCASRRLPQTGQLLRWLLGAGDKLDVLEPEELRHVVAEQARKMADLYPQPGSAAGRDRELDTATRTTDPALLCTTPTQRHG